MSAIESRDTCTITLGHVPRANAFSLHLLVDGADGLALIRANGPGVFRSRSQWEGEPFASLGQRVGTGAIVGFLQQGVLLLPLTMPEDGWPIAAAPDGLRVEHGTPVLRFIRANGSILP